MEAPAAATRVHLAGPGPTPPMIPVTLGKDTEQQVVVSSGPTFRRRRLFIAAGLAAGGLLILALAVLGYTRKNDASPTSMPSVLSGPIQGQDGVVDSSSSPVSTVLPTDPLQVVPYLFKKHTVPAVAVTAILVLLVVLAVALPIALSQSVEEVPVVVDPEPAPAPEPTPAPEPAPEPGFFDSSLNLGLVIGGVVVGLVGIGAIGFGAYRKCGAGSEPDIKGTLIREIMTAYETFKDADLAKPLDVQEGKCYIETPAFEFIFYKNAQVLGLTRPDNDTTVRRYNEILVRTKSLPYQDETLNGKSVILRAKAGDNYLGCDEIPPHDSRLELSLLDPKELKLWAPDDLEALRSFMQSLNLPAAPVNKINAQNQLLGLEF